MSVFEIEDKKLILLENLKQTNSIRQKVILYNKFFSFVLSNKDKKYAEVYILEFLVDYLQNLKFFDPFCIHPNFTSETIDLIKKIKNVNGLEIFHENISEIINKLENKLSLLNSVLNGEKISSPRKIFFPLLEEKSECCKDLSFGIVESLTIKVSISPSLTNFIVIPSEKFIEEKLQTQIENSWKTALDFIEKYVRKINPYHEVIISFDKKAGIYQGYSLGAALTLGFIEVLLKLYNSPTLVHVKEGIAFTGGMNQEGGIIETSQNIIEQKVEAVFFSEMDTLVLPKSEEIYAQRKINELKIEFPQKELKLIGIENLNDILNRRDLIDIQKLKWIVRSANFTKRNYVSFILGIIIIAIGIMYSINSIDKDPKVLFNSGYSLYVQNRTGKTLWTKSVRFMPNSFENKEFLSITQKLIDINNDGKNEVILCDEKKNKEANIRSENRVACFSADGHLIWQYQFKDTVSTAEDKHTNIYTNYIIDTTTENGRKVLFLFTRNNILYPSSIYRLDLKTGQRLPGTFWHSGQIASCLLGYFGGHQKKIIGVAINNSFNRSVLFSVDLKNLNGQGPAAKGYRYLGIPEAKLNKYILLPKSDYTNYFAVRFNRPELNTLTYNKTTGEFSFFLLEGAYSQYDAAIGYNFNSNLSLNDIYIGDGFQVKRDLLVKENKLHLPYSDTNAYKNILKNEIEYWNGAKFVKYNVSAENKESFALNH